MGSRLVRRFIASGRIYPSEITVAARTPGKLDMLKAEFSDIMFKKTLDKRRALTDTINSNFEEEV